MTMTASERASADTYAGPHHSFPLYSSGAHLRAAWMLAGHAADPAAVRARILAFARAHGLLDRLPKDATVSKADRGTARDLLQMAYQHEDGEGDEPQQHRLIDFARAHGIADALPAEAHRFMHDRALPHDHGDGDLYHAHPVADDGSKVGDYAGTPSVQMKAQPGGPGSGPASGATPPLSGEHARAILENAWETDGYGDEAKQRIVEFARAHGLMRHLPEEAHGFMHARGVPHRHGDDDRPQHVHVVRKAQAVAKAMTIEKAWAGDDGTATIEGWVSTDAQDQEKDVVPPEAFRRALPAYAGRRMPLSSEHQMKALPIGHGQRVALVRDGHIFAEAAHPSDPADFEHFPSSGTGVYGRYVINDPAHAESVLKGNIGGFSWVGQLREYEPLPGGGRRFTPDSVDPWLETTVAAYPINGSAVLLAAKAFATEEEAMDLKLEELLAGAVESAKREEAEAARQESVSKADIQALLDGISAKLDQVVGERVAKAVSESREGVGRKAPAASDDPREADPAAYIIRKSREVEELSEDDKALIAGITRSILVDGMNDGGE